MTRQDDVQTSVERADPLVGTSFDRRFRVDERIAAGGFGAIYRATHIKSGHQVALKVLLHELARDLGIVARFRREGEALTSLRCPHTITAYELGQAADKTLFIVMELLYGETLFERYQATGPLEWKRMVKIAREVCESLEEAHALGIVHRDLKPTNIHLEHVGDDLDFVKVLDFGIAKILGSGAADLTNAGQMIGTIDYMSPEQMIGGAVTGQSDIYTLGIVMYEMIVGAPPFGENLTAAQALAAVMKTQPEPLYLRAPVPDELDRIVMRCLERDTATRYQSVAELRHDLERLLEGVAPTRAHLVATRPNARIDDKRAELTADGELDPRHVDWGAAESTTLVPPPAALLAESRGARGPSDEATQLTPPPARLLEESRGHVVRAADHEMTQLTPPPAKLLARARGDEEWHDDDEQRPTYSARRDSSDEHDRVTAVATLAQLAKRTANTAAPATDRALTVPRTPALHPDERASTNAFARRGERVPTEAFQTEAATTAFSRGTHVRPATRPPGALPPHATSARKPPSQPPPVGAGRAATASQPPPVAIAPSQGGAQRASGAGRAVTPQTPIPHLVAAPFSVPAPPVDPYTPIAAPVAMPLGTPPPATFAVGRARDALVRRVVVVVALAALAGVTLLVALLV